MRARLVLLICVAIAGTSARAQERENLASASGRGDQHSEGWAQAFRLKGDPIPPKFPTVGNEIERVVLGNGLIVYLQEDHRLPLIDARVLIRTGSYYETADELGIADLTGNLLRRGGTKNYPPDELEERLDFLAANLNVSMGREQCMVSLNIMQKDTAEGLKILADLLRYPTFDEERLELAKQQTIHSLRSSNDSPGSILRREFARLLYTENHPGGRTPTIARIGQIGREDLVEFHRKYFHPNQIMIGLTGDFQRAEMLEQIHDYFGDWPQGTVNLPPLPRVNPVDQPGVFYVNKQVTQSNFWLGHWGTNRYNPDRFALDLMNDILGGSALNSRIGARVRNDEGLAYSVGTAFNTNQRDINFFIAAAQTKTESTVQAIESILDEIQKMKTTRISKNEFDTAKEMFLYSYVFRFTEPARSLGAVMGLEYEGLPADHLEKEFAGYQAVQAEDIERVGREYLQPEKLAIFIVGDFAPITEQAAGLGTIHEVSPFALE